MYMHIHQHEHEHEYLRPFRFLLHPNLIPTLPQTQTQPLTRAHHASTYIVLTSSPAPHQPFTVTYIPPYPALATFVCLPLAFPPLPTTPPRGKKHAISAERHH